MIYVSSSCVKSDKIADSVSVLASHGFTNIELSGGTNWYEGWLSDLLELKNKFNLNYLLHNYFPPPREPFVLNLASLDKEVELKSINHAYEAIQASEILNSKKIGFHAGFLINIPLNQIGKKIEPYALFNRGESWRKFVSNYKKLHDFASKKSIELYIENNVLSYENFKGFGENPFFFTEIKELREFNEELPDFKFIFDYAHCFVTSKTLQLDVLHEFDTFVDSTDYIHLSDNNGERDLNWSIRENSIIHNHLCKKKLSNKIITLEVYEGIDNLKSSYDLLKKIID